MFAALGIRLDFSAIAQPVDLSNFCDTETGRYDLTRPWTIGGHQYAANHHIMVRVPTSLPDDIDWTGIPKVLTRISDGSRLPSKAHNPAEFPWDCCRLADQEWPERKREYGLGSCPDHQVLTRRCPDPVHPDAELGDFCDQCYGIGYIATTHCAVCGQKKVHSDLCYRPCLQPMGDGLFLGERYDDLIRSLPGVRLASLTHASIQAGPPICFRFDGGEGMVMPCHPPEDGDKERYPNLDR